MFKIIRNTIIALTIISLGGFIYKVKKDIKPPITREAEQIIKDHIQGQIASEEVPYAVFVYKDDYRQRIEFINGTGSVIKARNIIFDPEFSNMLEYHKYDLCYIRFIDKLNSTSALAESLEKYNFEKGSKYISCPFFYDGVLIGYAAVAYEEDPIYKGVTPVYTNKLRYIVKYIETELSKYRL